MACVNRTNEAFIIGRARTLFACAPDMFRYRVRGIRKCSSKPPIQMAPAAHTKLENSSNRVESTPLIIAAADPKAEPQQIHSASRSLAAGVGFALCMGLMH